MVKNTTFSDLSASSAGALSISEFAALNLSNSTFAGCEASSGSAIVLEDARPSIISSSTFKNNSATYDGGGHPRRAISGNNYHNHDPE